MSKFIRILGNEWINLNFITGFKLKKLPKNKARIDINLASYNSEAIYIDKTGKVQDRTRKISINFLNSEQANRWIHKKFYD